MTLQTSLHLFSGTGISTDATGISTDATSTRRNKDCISNKTSLFFGFGPPPASAVPIIQDEKNQMYTASNLSAYTVSLPCVL